MNQATQKSEPKTLTTIPEFSEFEIKLIEFKDRYNDVVYNLDDADQEKQARSDGLAIGKVISKLDAAHKDMKAPLKAKTDLLDGERKWIKDDLQAVQLKIKSQIKEHERKIQEHAEMLQDKVDAIRYHAEVGDMHIPTNQLSAADLKERLVMIKSLDVDDSYDYRKADATLAQVDTIKILEGLLADRIKYEEEQAELERLRKEAAEREQADREERIRKEAAEQATKAAEAEAQRVADEENRKYQERAQAAETARLGAEQSAQQEVEEARRKQQEAEQAAENAAQAERDRIANEQAKVDAEAARVKQAEDARKATQEHRAAIHGAAKQALIDNDIPEDMAGKIVILIKDGFIKNIQVNY